MARRFMRIVTVEREVWYEEGTDWMTLLRKDERLVSAGLEYDPTRPAFDQRMLGEVVDGLSRIARADATGDRR
jgi:hypothetical protein